MRLTSQPFACKSALKRKYPRPDKVVSKAKSSRLCMQIFIYLRNNLLAAINSASGAKGDKPAAIRSALIKCLQFATIGRYFIANVVLPAPLGAGNYRTYWFIHEYIEIISFIFEHLI